MRPFPYGRGAFLFLREEDLVHSYHLTLIVQWMVRISGTIDQNSQDKNKITTILNINKELLLSQ